MSECTDKRFEQMLHAYELGLLNDNQRQEFEIHLLGCSHCWTLARQLKDAAPIINRDTDIQILMDRIVDESPEEAAVAAEKQFRGFLARRLRPILIPAVMIAIIVMVLILKPWQIQISPTQEAVAEEFRIAIIYFDNLANPDDPLKWGEIITNLLITDLAESQYLQVISSQRLYDLMRQSGHEKINALNRDIATEIASKGRAKWMIMGHILQEEPYMEITSQLVEVASGHVVAAQHITGGPDDDPFSLVDRLTAELKQDLTLPLEAAQELDRPVAEVTTNSAEAYRHYLTGVDSYYKLYRGEAIESFEKALTYDSTFAMAYYYLALLKDGRLTEKAVKYSNRAGKKEQHYIRSLEAVYRRDMSRAIEELEALVTRYPDEKKAYYDIGRFKYTIGDFDESFANLEKAIDIDPYYKPAYNQLAYAYDNVGNFEKALWAINKYIELAPDEANPYDTRGDIYSKNGRLDAAIESFQMALQIKPDFVTSLESLGRMYIFKREYAKAKSCIMAFGKTENERYKSSAGRYLVEIFVYSGQFRKALEILDSCIAAETLEITAGANTRKPEYKLLQKAQVLEELKDFQGAAETYEEYLACPPTGFGNTAAGYHAFYIQFLIGIGEMKKAEELADTLKQMLEESNEPLNSYWFVLGLINRAKGKPEQAVTYFEKVTPDITDFYSRFWKARAYLEAEQLEEAVAEFEKLLSVYSSHRVFFGVWGVRTHYYLGLAYERSKWFGKAVEQYQAFLDYWQNADTPIDEVEDAKIRLQRLSIKS
ncbi:MAG: tetratricopeptide repeat protein [candidate division Zixibacteria bacterium]